MVPAKAERIFAGSSRMPSALKSVNKDIYDVYAYGAGSVLAIHKNPIRFDLYFEDVLQVTANSEAFMHFDQKLATSSQSSSSSSSGQLSEAERHGGKEVLSYGEDGLAIYTDGTREEKHEIKEVNEVSDPSSFKESFGGHSDKRPNGPMSVGIDFSFPNAAHVYGIPEHATKFSLQSSKGDGDRTSHYKDPYRMYNLDVFEYELDEPMALYGHIPMMMGHGLVQSASGKAEPFSAVSISLNYFILRRRVDIHFFVCRECSGLILQRRSLMCLKRTLVRVKRLIGYRSLAILISFFSLALALPLSTISSHRLLVVSNCRLCLL